MNRSPFRDDSVVRAEEGEERERGGGVSQGPTHVSDTPAPPPSPHPLAATHQERAVKAATVEAFKWAGLTLAGASAVVLGACKLFPRFDKSLSVSSRTALIVSGGRGGGGGGVQGAGGGAAPRRPARRPSLARRPLVCFEPPPCHRCTAAAAPSSRPRGLPPNQTKQVTPVFAVYFLMGEFEMNEHKRARRALVERAQQQQAQQQQQQ